MTLLQAHRGVASEYPENTMAAFRAAVEQGYGYIELDPKYTADGKFVLLHDRTLKRTCLAPDGNEADAAIAELTLSEAREYDAGLKFSEEFKGEKIPTVSEVLELVKGDGGPTLKFDNVWESFGDMREPFLRELAASDGVKLGLTCATLEGLELAAKLVPQCELHYDGTFDDEKLARIREIAKGHRLVIWLCYGNALTSWYKGPKASAELCAHVREFADGVGVWLLTERGKLDKAVCEYRPDITETDGKLKPDMVVADM